MDEKGLDPPSDSESEKAKKRQRLAAEEDYEPLILYTVLKWEKTVCNWTKRRAHNHMIVLY